MLAFEILCISANHCTDQRNGIEKTVVPDALALLNMEDAHHLECLAWVVYDSALMVAHGPNFQVIALGAQCWLGYSNTSTGAAKTWPIAHYRR